MSIEEKILSKNSNLAELNSDYLYHLNINVENTKDTNEIQKRFGDVRFVCMGGTKPRMAALAKHLAKFVFGIHDFNDQLVDLCEKTHRYAVFKVGPILCCSHGVGMSSMSVVLHEIIKLVMYAKCKDPVFIRVGTCGGLGVPPGTVVVSENAYNGYLRKEHEIAILGNRVVRPAVFDKFLLKEILTTSEADDKFNVIRGNTMAAECFYEGQARLDGASCNYTQEDKMDFLQKCFTEYGIRNIEMEATMFASLTYHVGIRAADICVTLLNRLDGDQVQITMEQKEEFETRPMLIVGRYIKNALNLI